MIRRQDRFRERGAPTLPDQKKADPGHMAGTPDDRLRSAGLSRAKVASLKDLAAKTL